jgi:hypothetical protein
LTYPYEKFLAQVASQEDGQQWQTDRNEERKGGKEGREGHEGTSSQYADLHDKKSQWSDYGSLSSRQRHPCVHRGVQVGINTRCANVLLAVEKRFRTRQCIKHANEMLHVQTVGADQEVIMLKEQELCDYYKRS